MSKRGKSKKEALEIIAYIDGSLSGIRKESFEAKIASSAELSQEVLNQKRIRAALRALPKKRAPRNFMLSPEMIKQSKPKFSLVPAFSFASAGVTILLLAVFAGEFLLGNKSQTAMMDAAAPEMMVSDEDAPTEPMMIFWDAANSGGGASHEEAIGMGGGSGEPDWESDFLVPENQKEPAPEEQVVSGDLPQSKGVVEEQETVIFGINLDENDTDQQEVLRNPTIMQILRSVSIIRWIEIGLGTLALGFGITAITIWLKKKTLNQK